MLCTGTLSIRRSVGRHGPFNIGILSTDFAHYVVKDALIEEFDVGSYAGEFEVTKTFLKPYVLPGRLIIENRAILARINLAEDTLTVAESAAAQEAEHIPVAEIDPIDEEAAPSTAPSATTAAVPLPAADAPSTPAEPVPPADQESVATPGTEELARIKEQSYATLFGPLWPFGEEVKLDKTIDRLVLRKQIIAMNELGYEFQKKGQVYTRKAA